MKPSSLKAARYRARRARSGPSRIDAAPTVKALRYARDAGITWRDIGRAAQLDWQHVERIGNGRICGNGEMILRRTRDTILVALARLVETRRAALEDTAASIRFALAVKTPDGRWPTEPLRAALERRWGGLKSSPLSESDRTYLYRSETVDEARAERLCQEADVLPDCVWEGWFG